jgi:hypothetical protein
MTAQFAKLVEEVRMVSMLPRKLRRTHKAWHDRDLTCYDPDVAFLFMLTLIGLVQGVRHALEPDHLAAVSTLAVQTSAQGQRRSVRVMKFAAAWGAGHGTMLLVASGSMLVLGRAMPERWSFALEGLVACMLIVLGLRALWHANASARLHAKTSDDQHSKLPALPFAIGTLHGLAGSGALAALAASRVPSPWDALLFVMAYGAGAALGMVTLAALFAGPIGKVTSAKARTLMVTLSGAASLLVGLYWGAALLNT